MNLDPLSGYAGIGIARIMPTCMSASNTHFRTYFLTDRLTVHPVAMSVRVRVKQCSPEGLPPPWTTRSISTKPATASSQSARVRIGICDFSSVPGLVCDRPREISFARSGRVGGRSSPRSSAPARPPRRP